MIMVKIRYILLSILILIPLFVRAENVSERMSGNILLQVEQNGEAWYVDVNSRLRYFLNRPDDAFKVMRELGLGISNNDLFKIEIGSVSKLDNSIDSDGDGFSDNEEIKNHYNPFGPEYFRIEHLFADKHLGKIFLQVEENGEAWYVNPSDKKRYFMGRPSDAFDLMKELGVGINDEDLREILVGSLEADYEEPPKTDEEKKDVALDVLLMAAENFRSGDSESAKKFFTDKMYRFIDHIFLVLDPGERLLVANLMSGAKKTSSLESLEVFTTQVFFNGEDVPHDYNLIKQDDGSWLIDSL
ncbi:hypothetical protein C0584_01390 [Candidatus Parcubacteria bacterium]|nr:MAG: hypothetical protein C0584_01390 [Candidatus Parcubacteria bacterium]